MDARDPKSVTVWLIRALAYLAYAYLVVTQFILAQGFILRLLGANPDSGYVQWAYRSLDRSMEPFRGIFEPVAVHGDAVLDTSILFAMFIYGLLIVLVRALLDWLTFRLERIERYHAAEQAAAAIPSANRMPSAAEPPISHSDTPGS
ncbi:MAG TPA: hypothetical protein VMW08_03665 [Acidimicrobiales bacterium]|nr:hypothetical protein [Acidimicrobiales bacterium]